MIDHEEFIKVWQEAETVHDVARHFGKNPQYVRVRASLLRELGYKLKRFDKRGKKLEQS